MMIAFTMLECSVNADLWNFIITKGVLTSLYMCKKLH